MKNFMIFRLSLRLPTNKHRRQIGPHLDGADRPRKAGKHTIARATATQTFSGGCGSSAHSCSAPTAPPPRSSSRTVRPYLRKVALLETLIESCLLSDGKDHGLGVPRRREFLGRSNPACSSFGELPQLPLELYISAQLPLHPRISGPSSCLHISQIKLFKSSFNPSPKLKKAHRLAFHTQDPR
ncbi:hypothetical protein VTK73DRAFT_10181 [Phialemonium thermophilum]|uniref:Uncharacterized protein n=1 Tax=Phialemonium thermophilum TaxID=223376 RepID=A0ABR3VY73_9PEZI